ncbi:unnamed protein product [Cunninghamella echinulata]
MPQKPGNNDSEWQRITQDNNKFTVPIPEGLDLTVEHPLQNSWTIWFDNPLLNTNSQSWAENLKEIVTVNTVEEFWGAFNNLTKVDQLEPNSNYHIFKKGIKPEWEDPANAKGGKFSMQFPRARSGNTIHLFWLNMVLSIIGEQFVDDEVCGAVIAIRKNYFRIALWTKSAKRTEALESVGHNIRELLNLPMQMTVDFLPHNIDPENEDGPQKFTL